MVILKEKTQQSNGSHSDYNNVKTVYAGRPGLEGNTEKQNC